MTIASARLNLLAFPQSWDPAATGTVVVRFLCIPKGNPLARPATNLPTFAEANLKFEARIIRGLATAPRLADSQAVGPLTLTPPPVANTRKAVFDKLAASIQINPAAAPPRGARPEFRKPATDSYRSLTGNRLLSKYMVDGNGYECALNSAHETQPPAPEVIAPSFRWGQVIAMATRQPPLAQALGLIGEASVKLPDNGFYQTGGWLWIGLDPNSDYANTAGFTVSHAARIPALSKTVKRDIYTAVLFPIDSANVVLDDIFSDAERYDLGYARLVHGAQTENASENGDAIQLAWDDEQLADWLNRQLDVNNAAPMGTAGFRVDVRDITTNAQAPWNSLQKVTAPQRLKLGTTAAIDLGPYSGEGIVEVVPSRVSRTAQTEFWMPPYFATWRGTSLVVTDKDLKALHNRTAGINWSKAPPDTRLTGAKQLDPVGDTNVPLKYGRKYEFCVRMADLTGGGPGPTITAPTAADAFYTTTVAFRRRKPPGAVVVLQRPTRTTTLKVGRPRLAYPEILYTGAPNTTFATLEAALIADIAAGREDGLGAADPDVTDVEVTAQVRALSGDLNEWHTLYKTTRPIAANQNAIDIPIDFVDKKDLSSFTTPAANARLQMPTARDIRLILVTLGRNDLAYFARDELRKGPPVTVDLHVKAANELTEELIPSAPTTVSFFLRQPPPDGSVAQPVERLATELQLDHHGLTLAGRATGRTVFGCTEKLRHTLSPEGSAITFSSEADVTQQWVHALRFTLVRDWTWRGLAPDGLTISRQIQYGAAPAGSWEVVGNVALPTALSPNATKGVSADHKLAPRNTTNVVFFDAHDPKPDLTAEDPQFPTQQIVQYRVQAHFEQGQTGPTRDSAANKVPATTPPSQVPQLLSMGIALQELSSSADEFASRRAALWFEFADAPRDPDDAYFVRPLISAPDPLLIDDKELVVGETQPEPALPIDPEWMRVIRPGQAPDSSGSKALQAMGQQAQQQRQCYIVPLPEGVDASSPELLSMYTYEIRVGHKLDDTKRWCTANGRWGPPLRVAGIKHPPPKLMCQAARTREGILVRAPFATPTLAGRHVRPSTPKTQLWALIYARVQQADAAAWRHVLIGHAPLLPPSPGLSTTVSPSVSPPVLLGEIAVPNEALRPRLKAAGLPADADLRVLAVETFTDPTFGDPLGYDLCHAPFLRTSPLVPVPDAC